MAAESSTYIVPSSTLIIDAKFCMPFEVDLIIVRKLASLVEGNILATDINGNIIFRVRDTSTSSQHTRHVLQDVASNPIVSLHQKVLTAHGRWQVFKEDASDHHHLLFSVRKSSVMPTSKADIDVYLAANTKEHTSDYKIKGSWSNKSFTIYSGQGNTPIAQISKQNEHLRLLKKVLFSSFGQFVQMRREPSRTHTVIAGKNIFSVTVRPNVDYAFVVALIVVIEEIYEEKSGCITQELTTHCIQDR